MIVVVDLRVVLLRAAVALKGIVSVVVLKGSYENTRDVVVLEEQLP